VEFELKAAVTCDVCVCSAGDNAYSLEEAQLMRTRLGKLYETVATLTYVRLVSLSSHCCAEFDSQ